MTKSITWSSDTANLLRQEFDRSFAEPPVSGIVSVEDFLAIGIGGDPYAVRLAEIRGLYADRRIVPLPTPVPELLGMASFRGQIAPVYNLAALLGYSHLRERTLPRWLVLVRWRVPVALAFDAFETHLRVAPEAIVESSAVVDTGRVRPHTRGAVQDDAVRRPIVPLPAVLEDISQRVEATPMKKESDES